MNRFFEHQERARRNTRVLVALMLVAVVATGSALYGLLYALSRTQSRGAALIARPALLANGEGWWICVFAVAAFVGVASLWRTASLQNGAQLAESLGGRLVSGAPRDALERRLLNVVEEMAIASGVAVPRVFVLDAEQGINAFAAGFTVGDAAIAVTDGCLQTLNREELQGVIAHEFSHVLNGDMRLNLRLIGVVYGIVCIGLFGRLLLQLGGRSAGFGRRRNPLAWLAFVGLGVMLVGLIGELCGKLIKAAVSRQREFLADASAVQFTRNPLGVAGALRKIGGYAHGAKVAASGAEEASHFFFGDIRARAFLSGAFATHPPLGDRIRRIDPSFRGEFPVVTAGSTQLDDDGTASLTATPVSAPPPPHTVADQVGTADHSAHDHGARLLDGLPPALREAAGHPYAACAIVYALLLADESTVRGAQLDQLAARHDHALARETERAARLLVALPRRDRLPLIALLAPALQALSRDQRASFGAAVNALIAADERMSIFEYVVAHTLERSLTPHAAPRGRQRSLSGVQAELALLLSLLAHAGDPAGDGREAATAFAAATGRLPELTLALLPPGGRLLSALAPALDALRALAPRLRARVVDACAHAALADRDVNDQEWTLLRAVCGALECPLPPLPGF